MKTAISHWNGRISPVFDVSENVLLIEGKGLHGQERQNIIISSGGVFERVSELSGYGINTLICGAISDVQETALRNAGIEVIGFICGELEAVISAFAQGRLADGRFSMPGCCNRRRRHRCGHRNNTSGKQRWL